MKTLAIMTLTVFGLACKSTTNSNMVSDSLALQTDQTRVMFHLKNKEISDLTENSFTKLSLGIIEAFSPIKDEGSERKHYQMDKYTAKDTNVVFTLFYTYLDDEDGGNSYGWVTDSSGNTVASIADSFFYVVKPISSDHTRSITRIGRLPQVLPEAILTADKPALYGYLKSLIERYENKVENPNSDDENFLEIYLDQNNNDVCKTIRGGKTLRCNVSYLQDRWNGTMSVTLKIKADKIIQLNSAHFDGNF